MEAYFCMSWFFTASTRLVLMPVTGRGAEKEEEEAAGADAAADAPGVDDPDCEDTWRLVAAAVVVVVVVVAAAAVAMMGNGAVKSVGAVVAAEVTAVAPCVCNQRATQHHLLPQPLPPPPPPRPSRRHTLT
jgi:hypothetical protein